MTAPIICRWTGEVMEPLARFMRFADKQFVVGEEYPLVVQEERSQATHNHYFAAVNEAWKNLPERLAHRFPTAEHLRKYALIKAGYADERSIACATPEEALRLGSFVKPLDEYAVVVVHDAVVKVFTPQSQSNRAMDKRRFQESKEKVLEVVAEMVGVDVATLTAQSGIPESATSEGRSTESRDTAAEQAGGLENGDAFAGPEHGQGGEEPPTQSHKAVTVDAVPAERTEASALPPSRDAASGAAATAAAGGRADSDLGASSTLFAEYGQVLFRATRLASLQKLVEQFWELHAYPGDDDKACDRFDAMLRVHERRVRGQIDAKRCAEEMKALVI